MKYICSICNHVFDESEENLKFSDLPESYRCPVCNMDKSYFEVLKEKIERKHVEIKESNPSLCWDKSKCVDCGLCKNICYSQMNINSDDKEIFDCINCGQCINNCPTEALSTKEDYKDIIKLMEDKSKVFIVSTSPSIRVSLGEEFSLEPGSFVENKMIALLRKLGFKYVLDVNFAADLTIMEEASELIKRVTENKNLPLFTSCCPAWIKYIEKFEPSLIDNISTAKSPIGMQGASVKSYFASANNIKPENIVHVVVAPCTAKKFEIKRSEMKSASKLIGKDFYDTDYVITTKELAKWTKDLNLEFNDLLDSNFDALMGESTGAGTIFGASGGVMEAALRTASMMLLQETSAEVLNLESIRGLDEIKETKIQIGDINLSVAVVYGIKNAKKIIEKVKNKEKHYDFIEVMACPGGCIAGGGQPKIDHAHTEEVKQNRIDALYKENDKKSKKVSMENSDIEKTYETYYDKPLSLMAKKLLHTKYTNKENDIY